VPIYFDTDREVIEAALGTLSLSNPRQARVAWIADTLAVEWLQVSEALLREDTGGAAFERQGEFEAMSFDGQGNLVPAARR
jgi:hypothetical protein